ncbi:sensor histidine kinase [Yinghuangia sp. ASG 101]|uniref:sensor histidine kinase n=1 Tax=Yinghuangia sp. ASG 101 TaxID=2896848 RepID=UPI001E5EC688|nr:sensor histidine kinase [Yinghuangia sp. ASG 101]UGQ08905.1 sensor histidine kinase [Yinghuangia sp. ASG 101]
MSEKGSVGFRRGGIDALRGLALIVPMVAGLVLFCLTVTFIPLMIIGVGVFVVPMLIAGTRALADVARRRAELWGGVPIARPYRPRPEFDTGLAGLIQRCRWLMRDPATWRDLLWLIGDWVVGFFLAILPLAFIAEGLFGVIQPFLWKTLDNAGGNNWYTFLKIDSDGTALLAVPLGLLYVVIGFLIAPKTLRAHAVWTRSLLAPTRAAMEMRVRHLTETRTDAVDASAAEIRRIERDLHDGAQARLVAMGMNLGAAEAMLESNPEAARALLTETREASAKALNELRDLVRGIHPPVLADRGLGDAVRALALESALDVEVTVEVPGRLEAPVESAGYFAVSEVLTNVAKHAGARHVWIDLRYRAGRLRIEVVDDGRGGASLNKGTGLRGIERRLGTFDGTLALDSPQGGPTTVTMELPCVLSSPKISPS